MKLFVCPWGLEETVEKGLTAKRSPIKYRKINVTYGVGLSLQAKSDDLLVDAETAAIVSCAAFWFLSVAVPICELVSLHSVLHLRDSRG